MAKIGRNAPCPCGNGKKYKKCCLRKDKEAQRQKSFSEYQINEEAFDDLEEDEDEVGWRETEDSWPSDEEREAPGTDYLGAEEVSYPQIDKSIPAISESERAKVDEWWEGFSPIYRDRDADEMIRRIEGYFFDIPRKKRPKKAFNFEKNRLDQHMAQSGMRFIFLSGVLAISLLQAVYYFAEYLKKNRIFSNEDMNNSRQVCLSLFETCKKALPASDAGPRIFSTFPNYQCAT